MVSIGIVFQIRTTPNQQNNVNHEAFQFLKKEKTDGQAPPEVNRYLEHFKIRVSKNTPFRQARFVVLDTEATGLDIKNDHILSIGAVGIKDFGLKVEDRLEVFIQQKSYAPNESISVHGITNRKTSDGITEEEALLSLLDFLRESTIVGHHIGFDKAILDNALLRHFGLKLKNPTLDTASLERRLHAPLAYQQNFEPPASLDALCQKYSVEMGERHTAAGDAFITGIVFLKQLARLEKKGIHTLGDLLKK